MSSLKMFFCMVTEFKATNITIHRELNSIYTLWNNETADNKVGIIHVGFTRPKVPSYEEVQCFHGGVLVSASAKWSLPEEYNTSNKTVYESSKLSLFQLLTGFGYNIDITDEEGCFDGEPILESPLVSDSNHTIASAALEVLESLSKPMSKEEIYGYIIEGNLFQFGPKKPVNVLNVELNRHCEETGYSNASSNNLFGKTNAGLFFSLSSLPQELRGWLKELQRAHPELLNECSNLWIYDDFSYLKKRNELSDQVRRELDLIRFKQLKSTINKEDPSALIPILPACILDADIGQLGFTVRASNVFSVQQIFTLNGAVGIPLSEMMTWPNFGKKSARDLCEVLINNVERLTFQLPSHSVKEENAIAPAGENTTVDVALEYVSQIPLKQHVENSLSLPQELRGWLKELQRAHPELLNECSNLWIYDDFSYLKKRNELSDQVRRELDLIRFKQLKSTINKEDPSALIPILPACILDADIGQLGFTVRASNVFSVQQIFTLNGAVGIPLSEMMTWPNFGKKSARDLCEVLINNVERLTFQLPSHSVKEENAIAPAGENTTVDVALEHVSQIPLKQHVENSLSLLKDKERQVLEYRTGYKEPVKTLEEVGQIIGVTRERVRQIQKKNINKIITTEYWDDCIAIKIGGLLFDREQPLYLEMLEIEDEWFLGFIGHYQCLAAIIQLFSENQIKLLTINGAVIISRICQEDWDSMVSSFKKSLKSKAKEQCWSKDDINLTFKSALENKGAPELLSVLWGAFNESLQFSTQNQLLIAYGKTGESAVYTVLQQAEGPLHFSEVAERASVILGKRVEERLAHNSLPRHGGKLFGRGIYGLPKFNPISDITCKHIRLVVAKEVYEGPLAKQWHVTELLNSLKDKFPSLPIELDMYILNIILEDAAKLTYLNKNVWVRTDSGQLPGDRVDMGDAFSKILEDAGKPLKGKEIKARLEAVRGVHASLQIQSTERMIQVGPDTWGLIERDIDLSEEEQANCMERLFAFLTEKQKGIHVTEVDSFLSEMHLSHLHVGGYALLNIAQRDDRFYLGYSMFLGLAEWGDDTRRFTYAQAIRKILEDMCKPMSIGEIHAQVEMLTGLEVDNSVTRLLIQEGGEFNVSSKLWGNG